MSNPCRLCLTSLRLLPLCSGWSFFLKLVRRQQEELILEQVPLPPEWLEEQRQAFLADQSLDQVLETRGWSERDLDLHLQRPEALRRFARQRFGPGLEDTFFGLPWWQRSGDLLPFACA